MFLRFFMTMLSSLFANSSTSGMSLVVCGQGVVLISYLIRRVLRIEVYIGYLVYYSSQSYRGKGTLYFFRSKSVWNFRSPRGVALKGASFVFPIRARGQGTKGFSIFRFLGDLAGDLVFGCVYCVAFEYWGGWGVRFYVHPIAFI